MVERGSSSLKLIEDRLCRCDGIEAFSKESSTFGYRLNEVGCVPWRIDERSGRTGLFGGLDGLWVADTRPCRAA